MPASESAVPNGSPAKEVNNPVPEVDAVEAQKIADMQARIASLESQIEETKAKKEDVAAKLKDPDVHATVSKHIKLLHKYNEIRDVGQGLMGLIADQRGVRIVDVYDEFGVGEGD